MLENRDAARTGQTWRKERPPTGDLRCFAGRSPATGAPSSPEHVHLKLDADIDVWFCDPHRPWERGTNQKTNGLLRQYFARSTDVARHSRGDLDAVALPSNTRPRKTSDGRTPPSPRRASNAHQDRSVLLRPLGSAQFRSRVYVSTLSNATLAGSMGRVGAAGGNAPRALGKLTHLSTTP